jgi:hypothetical protein
MTASTAAEADGAGGGDVSDPDGDGEKLTAAEADGDADGEADGEAGARDGVAVGPAPLGVGLAVPVARPTICDSPTRSTRVATKATSASATWRRPFGVSSGWLVTARS